MIWYGGSQFEGLDGGYSFKDTVLRDPDGDAIDWRPATQMTAKKASNSGANNSFLALFTLSRLLVDTGAEGADSQGSPHADMIKEEPRREGNWPPLAPQPETTEGAAGSGLLASTTASSHRVSVQV